MRILVLTILFVGLVYFMKDEVNVAQPAEKVDDSIKVFASAPHRIDKKPIIVHESKTIEAPDVEVSQGVTEEETAEAASSESSDMEHVEQFDDLEAGWNNELKEMLMRLEPMDGEEIHKNYVTEQETYQTEMEALLNEKQQKTTPESTVEMDELIYQLDERHQARLKDILGAHYDAVKDGLENFMKEASPE